MTARREIKLNTDILSKGFFQQQRKCRHIKSTDKSLWTEISRSSLARPCSPPSSLLLFQSFSWRRALFTFALIQQPANRRLFGCLTLTSLCWHLAVVELESLLCFLVCFFSPRRFCLRRFRASRRSWSFRSYSLSVRCSVSHRQVFVFVHAAQFWRRRCRLYLWYSDVFFVHSIHSTTFLF